MLGSQKDHFFGVVLQSGEGKVFTVGLDFRYHLQIVTYVSRVGSLSPRRA